MGLFRINGKKLVGVESRPVTLERDLQRLTEANLDVVFGLQLVSSEFTSSNLRIDTLAIDPESNSFVIIEYKRDKSSSVIDQGFSYLSRMLNNKAEFILECNEKLGRSLKRDDIDWSQARVMFLAASFSVHQLGAINFRDLPIELWEVTLYDNDTILYEQIEASGDSSSIKTVSKNKQIESVTKEVKKYTEEDIINERGSGKARELYQRLKEKILLIDQNLVVHPTKTYISLQMPGNWRNIIGINFRKDRLVVDFLRAQPKDFKDPEGKLIYRETSFKNFHQHISSIDIDSTQDIDYTTFLIKQQYDHFLKDHRK
ncbi:MAG TPA: DUF5655 domain-containing protein [Candidatus Paceibacterota bacterium]